MGEWESEYRGCANYITIIRAARQGGQCNTAEREDVPKLIERVACCV